MSSLELLKKQIDIINTRIVSMEDELENRKKAITDLNIKKEEIQNNLITEELKYNELLNNYNYLSEVKQNTTNNYNQILESANTLLDILKNKCDGI
jgi:chromosome segregation ATPase